MQALVLLVCPLILVATILLIDLRTRRRVLADHDAVTYRPSLAVRFAWTTAMTVLLANLFPTRHQHWILLSANLLALLELVRTFPRSLTLTPEGLHWRSLTGSTSLSWDHIACFAEKRSVLGTEYQFFGDEDQVFVLSSAVNPAWTRPEDFPVHQYDDTHSVSGQDKNDAEAQKKSRQNRGSLRVEGNVNQAGPPHWDLSD